MSQVVIEMGRAMLPEAGGAQIFSMRGTVVEEITSSGTSQATSITAPENGSIAVVINNGADSIWVNVSAPAAVGIGHFVASNTQRDFGPVSNGDTISVINDS